MSSNLAAPQTQEISSVAGIGICDSLIRKHGMVLPHTLYFHSCIHRLLCHRLRNDFDTEGGGARGRLGISDQSTHLCALIVLRGDIKTSPKHSFTAKTAKSEFRLSL